MAVAVLSLVLYAAPAWKKALKFKYYRDMLERVNRRLALGIIRGYRTVSSHAAQVLAGTIPIDVLVEERAIVYDGAYSAVDARQLTYTKWQERWEGYQGWAKKFHCKCKTMASAKMGRT